MAETTDTLRAVDLPRPCSALTLRMVEVARNRPTDLFGDAAARVSRCAFQGYLGETAAWNNVVDALRELGQHVPNDKILPTCATGDTNEAKDA